MTDQKRIIEALLFAAETPLSVKRLADVLGLTDLDAVRQSLVELVTEYDELDRAFNLVEVAGGYQFRTRSDFSFWLKKMKKTQLSRLSRAALEVLAVVAYKQPVTKAEVDLVRGVECGGVLRTLLEKGLIRVTGRKELPGRPMLYGTTQRFLEVFDLKDLQSLPTVDEIKAMTAEGDLERWAEQESLLVAEGAEEDDDVDESAPGEEVGLTEEPGDETAQREETGQTPQNRDEDQPPEEVSAGPGEAD